MASNGKDLEPLALDLVVKYIQRQEEGLGAEDIIAATKHCSLFVLVGNNCDIRLHRIVDEAVRTFCLFNETEKDHISKAKIPNERRKNLKYKQCNLRRH